MTIFYNENGDEVEGFLQEELEATVAKERATLEEQYKKQVAELEDKVKEVESKIIVGENEGDKAKNFKNLREVKDALSEQLTKQKDEYESRIANLEREMSMKELRTQALSVARGDAELAKQIEKHYFEFASPKDGETDDRMEKAYKLATFSTPAKKIPNFAIPVNGSAPSFEPRKPGELTAEQKELARKMGLSEEDLK